jgi:Bacterial sugar transferase
MCYASFTNLPASIEFPAHSVDDGKAVSPSVCGNRWDALLPERFHQARRGYNKEPIRVLEFRSVMEHASDFTPATKHDPRVIRPFLRLSNIEELLQFGIRRQPGASYGLVCEALVVQPLALVPENAADFQ